MRRGGGGELLYEKDRGACLTFSKEPLRGTKTLFGGRGLKSISPLRGTNLIDRLCWAQYSHLQVLQIKALAVGPFEAEQLKMYQIHFCLNPKRYNKHPPPFYMRVPPE